MSGNEYYHLSSAKAAVFTHDSPNGFGSQKIDITYDIQSVSVEKDIGSPGKWQLVLVPGPDRRPTQAHKDQHTASTARYDYLRYIQPNDVVVIYLSNGHPGRDPSLTWGGFHPQVLGYVDTVSQRTAADSEGRVTKRVILTGTDHAKAWSASNLYFNQHVPPEKTFGASFAGLKLKQAGIPAQGSPADFARFFLLSPATIGSQMQLPQSLVDTVRTNIEASNSDHYNYTLFGNISDMMAGLLLKTPGLVPSSSIESDKNNLSESFIGDNTLIGHFKAVLAAILKIVGSGEFSNSELVQRMTNQRICMAHLIDFSYIEDLYIRGFRFSQAISQVEGNVYSILKSMSDPLLNESFFDLRLVGRNTPSAMYVDDIFGMNTGGPAYTPAYVLREYPFFTGKIHPLLEGSFRDGKLSMGIVKALFDKYEEDEAYINEGVEAQKKKNQNRELIVAQKQVEDVLSLVAVLYYTFPKPISDADPLLGRDVLRFVAWVIKNRVSIKSEFRGRDFGATYKQEAQRILVDELGLTKEWDKIDSDLLSLRSLVNTDTYGHLVTIAEFVLYEEQDDPTNGALYYMFPAHSHMMGRYVDYTIRTVSNNGRRLDVADYDLLLPSDQQVIDDTLRKYAVYNQSLKANAMLDGTRLPVTLDTYAGKTEVLLDLSRSVSYQNYGVDLNFNTPRVAGDDNELSRFPNVVDIPDINQDVTVVFLDPDSGFKDPIIVTANEIKILNTEFSFTGTNSNGNGPELYPLYNSTIPIKFLFPTTVSGPGDYISTGMFPNIALFGVDPSDVRGGAPPSTYFSYEVVDELDVTREVLEGKKETGSTLPSSSRIKLSDLDLVDSNSVDFSRGVFFRNRLQSMSDIDTPTALQFKSFSLPESSSDVFGLIQFIKNDKSYIRAQTDVPGINRRFIDHVVVNRDEVVEEVLTRSDKEHINLVAAYANFLGDSVWVKPVFNDFIPIMNELGFRRHGLRVFEKASSWYEVGFSTKGLYRSYVEISMLIDMFYQHNSAYLTGTLTMRGRPDIRVGYRLDYDLRDPDINPNGLDLSFYVEGVSQNLDMDPDGITTYLTTVTVTRGQPYSEDERFPYVPPNWYFYADLAEEPDAARKLRDSLPENTGRYFRDVALSQQAYRNSAEFMDLAYIQPISGVPGYDPFPDSLVIVDEE